MHPMEGNHPAYAHMYVYMSSHSTPQVTGRLRTWLRTLQNHLSFLIGDNWISKVSGTLCGGQCSERRQIPA